MNRLKTYHFSDLLFPLSSEKGVVIMMVLWVVVFLSVIVAELAQSARTEILIMRNLKEEAEARALADAGVSLAFAEILKDYDYTVLGQNNDTMLVKKKSLEEEETEELGAPKRKNISFHVGVIEYSIIDENRKININTATEVIWEKLLGKAGLDIGSERGSIVDAILDWTDTNDLFRMNGAEDEYYMSLPKPYHCKNGYFDTVGELLLVKGMTKEILYGDGDEFKGIHQYLTIYNSGKINLNTASIEVLEVTQGEKKANEIIEKREANDGVYDEAQRSETFTINAMATVASISRKINLVCKKTGKGDKAAVTVLLWNDDAPI